MLTLKMSRKTAGFITPVPGGVGPMTITMLLENTLIAAENSFQKKRKINDKSKICSLDVVKNKDKLIPFDHLDEESFNPAILELIAKVKETTNGITESKSAPSWNITLSTQA